MKYPLPRVWLILVYIIYKCDSIRTQLAKNAKSCN